MEQKLFFPALVLFVLFLGPVYAETYNTATISRIDVPRITRVNENVLVVAEVFVDNSTFVNTTLVVDGEFIEKKSLYVVDSDSIELNYVPNSAGRKKLTVIAEVFGGSDEKSRNVFVYSIDSTIIVIVLVGAGAVAYYYFYYKKWVARTEPEEFKQRGESKT